MRCPPVAWMGKQQGEKDANVNRSEAKECS